MVNSPVDRCDDVGSQLIAMIKHLTSAKSLLVSMKFEGDTKQQLIEDALKELHNEYLHEHLKW